MEVFGETGGHCGLLLCFNDRSCYIFKVEVFEETGGHRGLLLCSNDKSCYIFVDRWLFFSGGGLRPEVSAMISHQAVLFKSTWSSGGNRWFPAKAVRFLTRKLYL